MSKRVEPEGFNVIRFLGFTLLLILVLWGLILIGGFIFLW